MAQKYSIMQQGDTATSYLMEVAVDKREDIEELPTKWLTGSSCIVIEDSSVWMLGIDGEWHELP